MNKEGWETRAANQRTIFQVSLVILTFLILFAFNFQNVYNTIKDSYTLLFLFFLLSSFASFVSFLAISDLFFGEIEEKYVELLNGISISLFTASIILLLLVFSFGNAFYILYFIVAISIFIVLATFFSKYRIIKKKK